jgi:Flp pilus assembly protein TadG
MSVGHVGPLRHLGQPVCHAGDGRRRREENGFMAVELVMLTPLLLGAIMIIIGASRYVDARDQVSAAAFAAGRAASLTSNADEAYQRGRAAAAGALAERGPSCATLRVGVNTANFTPGGSVRVTVTCVADLSDVVGFGLPGHKAFTITAVVPIDVHRVM